MVAALFFGPGSAGVSRSESHFIPKSWANSMAAAGERDISSVMALTRELSIRFGAAEEGTAAASVAAKKERDRIFHLGVSLQGSQDMGHYTAC